MFNRQIVMVGIAVLSLVALAQPGAPNAQDKFPSKPIKLIAGFPAGGWIDMTNRIVSGALEGPLGVQVVSVPTPGASGTVASMKLKQIEADGYTLLMQPSGTLFTRTLINGIEYSYQDFTPIFTVAASVTTISVHVNSPWKTLDDFIKDAKANPGQYTYSTAGPGGIPHMAIEAVKQKTGIDVTHVPYRGGPASVAAVLGGHADLVVGDNTNPEIRPLVTTHPRRSTYFPDTPTMKESGYDLAMAARFSIIGPKGIPKERVAVLVAALQEAVKKRPFAAALAGMQLDPLFETADELAEVWARQGPEFKAIVESLDMAHYQKKKQ